MWTSETMEEAIQSKRKAFLTSRCSSMRSPHGERCRAKRTYQNEEIHTKWTMNCPCEWRIATTWWMPHPWENHASIPWRMVQTRVFPRRQQHGRQRVQMEEPLYTPNAVMCRLGRFKNCTLHEHVGQVPPTSIHAVVSG